MFNSIDNFLNRTTMYRLVLYALVAFTFVAILYSALGILPYNPLFIVYGTAVIVASSVLFQRLFARAFRATTNSESIYITALILVLLIHPPAAFGDAAFLTLAIAATAWAAASKFLLARYGKHVFNPVAIGLVIPSLVAIGSADWWVGTLAFLPLVAVFGLMITRKIRRFDLVLSFLIAAVAAILLGHPGGSIALTLWHAIAYSPLLFFAFVMLTEPLTTPPTRARRILYGTFVGLLFLPSAHIGSVYITPELALVAGNLMSYFLSPPYKYLLRLVRRENVATDTYDFVFTSNHPVSFRAGQYLEWTLGGVHGNSRGNRRYFTIASAPGEREVRMGVKFYEPKSAFKERLLSLVPGDSISAGQLAGDFTMPANTDRELIFIAGGIGITPFRSMVRSLVQEKTTRPITVFYANKTVADIAYTQDFMRAEPYGVRTIYTLTDLVRIPHDWRGERGYVTADMIKKYVPTYTTSHFYLSGPNAMVREFSKTLRAMGIPRSHIKKDYFPGFA